MVLAADTARAIYGDADPVGKKIDDDDTKMLQIVGVVEEYRKDGETGDEMNMMFRRMAPNAATAASAAHIMVRVHPGTPPQFEEELAARLQQIAHRACRSGCATSTDAREHAALPPHAAGGRRRSRRCSSSSMVALGLTGRALAERHPPHARDRPAPRHGRTGPTYTARSCRGGAAGDDRPARRQHRSSCSSRSSAPSRSSRPPPSPPASPSPLRPFTPSRYFAGCTRAGSRRGCNRRMR